MTKTIQILNVPEETYWEWSKMKDSSEYNNWFEFFNNQIDNE